MAGYTRQSIADIINGAEITAPPLNAEFNQLSAAFNATTGHSHDGTAGNSPKINLTTSVAGYLPAAHGGVGGLNNTTATTNPVVTDDSTQGYAPGSIWENTTTGRIFICVGNASGAAVWRELVQVQTSNVIFPEVNDTVDLGSVTNRFQDLFLSGGIAASGNTSLGGTLNVNGSTALSTTLAVTGLSTLATVDINGGNIDGTVIGASTRAAGNFTTTSTTGLATLASADINGGTIDGTVIGGSTATTVTGTNVTATTGFSGDLTGSVTGNVTGNLTGNVTGNVDGNVTGDVTSTGTSTFQNVTVNGSLNMNAGTAATVTGLSAPVNATDAATKLYVDTSVSNLVASAPGALDTLNELAAALGDDPNFATTITTSIATKVSKAGDTMTGNLAMSNAKITGLGTPTAGTDATTKTYVDGQDATKLNLSGGTMTGGIVMGANKVTSTATPTVADDLTRKGYVDSILGSATSAADSAAAASSSATSAANSAAASLTSEQNADTSETNAANSAAAALVSEQNAASSAASINLNNIDINGGTIDGTVIGGSTPAAISGTTITGTSFVTTGDMTFGDNDKAIFGAGSNLSIYTDGNTSFIQETGAGNFAIDGTNIFVRNGAGTANMAAFVDGGAATLYHNSSDKLATTATGIDVTGTITSDGLTVDGVSVLNGNVGINIGIPNANLEINSATGSTLRLSRSDGSITTDDLIGKIEFHQNDPSGEGAGVVSKIESINQSSFTGFAGLVFSTGQSVSLSKRLQIDGTGDISFYEDTGTTPKFFWDASAESLGINVTDPIYPLEVQGQAGIEIYNGTGGGGVLNFRPSLGDANKFNLSISSFDHSGGGVGPADGLSINGFDGVSFATGSSTVRQERLRITSTGNVGIGTTTPNADLELGGTGEVLRLSGSSTNAYIRNTDGTTNQWYIGSGGVAGLQHYIYAAQPMTFHTSGLERARIDASGNLLVGTTSVTSGKLNVVQGTSSALTVLSQSSASGDGGTSNTAIRSTNLLGTAWANTRYDAYTHTWGIGGSASANSAMTLDASSRLTIGYTSAGNAERLGASGTVISTGQSINTFTYDQAGFDFDTIAKQGRFFATASGGTGYMSFYTGSGTERARIDSSGNLLVGTTSNPGGSFGGELFVVNTAGNTSLFRTTAGSGAGTALSCARTSNGIQISFHQSGSAIGSIDTNGTSTSYGTSSDYRLKEDVQPMTGASERVLALKPVNFAWKVNGSRIDGFLAHEAQAVVPEAVTGAKDDVDDEGNPKYQGIDQSKLVPLLTAALQEALQKIEALEARITALEA
jgi:hypothetical protein